MDPAETLTRLRVDVAQRFASGFRVAAALDVQLAPGSVLVLFGPSGAGKTTILRHIAGLERPDAGVISWRPVAGPEEIWCHTSRGVWREPQARKVGIVFQQPTLFPHLTVAENIRYGVWHGSERGQTGVGVVPQRGQSGARVVSDSVAEIAALLELGPLEKRYPRQLSGGEAQRVALARALAPGPRLLLLDEPFAALDAPARARLRRELRALLQRVATPAILVTHDRTEALALGDTMAIAIGGRVRQVGTTADVFGRPVDADVAAALGIDAVLPARVVDASDGLLSVAVGDAVLHAAERDPLERGASVYACIRAEDVTVEIASPAHASARNHLAATITGIAPEGAVDRIALDCGFPLDALITRRSREELHLARGMRVTAAFKATSVHLVPRL